MNPTRLLSVVAAAAAMLAIVGAAHAGEPPSAESPPRQRMTAIRLGGPITITCYAEADAAKPAIDAALAEAKRLDLVFSDYDPDSELRRLEDAIAARRSMAISSDLRQTLFVDAAAVAAATDGAFDPTVGPLTRLWRRTRRTRRPHDSERIARARDRVGFRYLTKIAVAETADGTIAQPSAATPPLQFDLGGIAKGAVLDAMAAAMRSRGVDDFLIDAGGDLIAGGSPPGRDGWTVAIAPLDPTQLPTETIALRDGEAVATSGDAARFIASGGERESHILDPRTGRGVRFRSSVSVRTAGHAAYADALASAISVLGVTDSKTMIAADRPETFPQSLPWPPAVRIAWVDDEGRHVWRSPGWRSSE